MSQLFIVLYWLTWQNYHIILLYIFCTIYVILLHNVGLNIVYDEEIIFIVVYIYTIF